MLSNREVRTLAKNELKIFSFLFFAWGIQLVSLIYLLSYNFESTALLEAVRVKLQDYDAIVGFSFILFLVPIESLLRERKGRAALRIPRQIPSRLELSFLCVGMLFLAAARTLFCSYFKTGIPKIFVTVACGLILFTVITRSVKILRYFYSRSAG